MTWQGRNLPPNWSTLRRQRFTLDRWTCVDCGHHDPTGATLECDHIGHRDDHRIEQLRTRCKPCHARRTTTQRQAAIDAMPKAKRPIGRHPGMI